MNELELRLKELIITQYGSLKKFAEKIGMPWTTLDSILKRGVANSNIGNVLKITQELGLNAEKLAQGEMVYNDRLPQTLAAHFEGEGYTEDELNEIRQFAEFVKNRKNK